MRKALCLIPALALLVLLSACGMKSYELSEYDTAEVNQQVMLMFKQRNAVGYEDETVVIARNLTDREFTYGAAQRLEVMRDSHWCIVPDRQQFTTMQVFTLAAGGTDELSFNFKDHYGKLRDGQYRIIKVFVDSEGGNAIAAVQFQIGR